MSSTLFQTQVNHQALESPQPGDYWHERFCPYFLVVALEGPNFRVLSALGGPHSHSRKNEINAYVDNGDGTWSWDYDKTQVVTRQWITDLVTYQSSSPPDHDFVADVVRSGEKSECVREWREHRVRQLLQEFKSLGPEASIYLLRDHDHD